MDREISERLASAAIRRNNAAAELEDARTALAGVIREAAKAGMRQVQIVLITGYTRDTVRKIVGDESAAEA